MPRSADPEFLPVITRAKQVMATYADMEELIRLGAYRPGSSAEVDEAIRRIIQSHENYPPFPPALAKEVDVIEIRRTWLFGASIRLY